jgi:SAM-dependent methyltransferase
MDMERKMEVRDLPESLQLISPLDTMLDNGPDGRKNYFSAGDQALAICRRALGDRHPNRVVDFPVGFGRVARWFRYAWPHCDLYGVELDGHALDFTSSAFSLTPIQADPELKSTQLPEQTDLIFSGSLLTHFDEFQWDAFFKMCIPALSPDGILVFTIHGRVSGLLAADRHPVYGDLIDTKLLYETYLRDGFAFEPYAKDYPTFGLSLSSPAWVMKKLQQIPELKIVGFEEQGWGQDVVILRKNPWPMAR